MCQVIPFTLPCCRRVYVEVSKLPSCPNSWPNRKCPPELCIQVRGYEAEDRDAGICWRCKASKSGASRHDREALRPKIDKASLVLGLEEIGVSGRRRKMEQDGECWFCGARGGCKTCGARDIEMDEGAGVKVENTGFKKRPREVEASKGKGKGKEVANKRLKIERREHELPAAAYVYPDPTVASKLPEPYSQAYSIDPQGAQGYSQESQLYQQQLLNFDQDFGADNFSYDGLSQMVGTMEFEAGAVEQTYSPNWQAVNTQQKDTPGLSNANSDLQQSSQFLNQRARVDFELQQHKVNFNEHPSRPSSSTDPSLQQSTETESSNNNTGQQQSSQLPNVERRLDLKPQHHPVTENLPRPSQGISRPSQQQAHQFNSDGPPVDFKPPQNHLFDYVSHSNSENIGQYCQMGNDKSPNDFKPQQHYANEYTLFSDHGIDPALLQDAVQQSTAPGHSNNENFQDELSRFMNDGLQTGFNPQQHSNQYASYPDQNIHPGLQDVPSLFDFATMDDTALSRQIESHDCHTSTAQFNTNFQLAVSEQGPSNAGKQTQRPL